ncbi:MAG TPA: SemiSWEET family transporter [Candidatus Saccharimonadales bacterium]|nr:SemiSWEET family transporter [Candidatus Saccharimonadales bacterium]
MTTAIGLIASFLTMFNLFPQFLKVWQTKHTKDLSLATFVSVTVSAVLWVIYGILKNDLVITFANSVVFCFSAYILAVKIKHG